MEPEVRRYLKRVLYSLMMGLLWLFLNSTFGIYFGLAITHGGVSTYNIIFYAWLGLSLGALLLYYYRLWKD